MESPKGLFPFYLISKRKYSWDFASLKASMSRWLTDDDEVMKGKGKRNGQKGKPHWEVELTLRRRKSLPKPGVERLLGAAEDYLVYDWASEALKANPYSDLDCQIMIRDTLATLGVSNPMTKKRYSATGPLPKQLFKNIVARARADGINFKENRGQGQSKSRAQSATIYTVEHYTFEHRRVLKQFQEENGPIGLEDWGNWDESMLDLLRFVKSGIFLFVDLGPGYNNIVVPWEKSPHITLLLGFIGRTMLRTIMLIAGNSEGMPSPDHAQCLRSPDTVAIGQTESAWITNDTKYAAFEQWVEDDTNPIGERPTGGNFDGHDSNSYNRKLHKKMLDSKFLGAILPAHMTHDLLQQLDKRKMGLISCFKEEFDPLMARQVNVFVWWHLLLMVFYFDHFYLCSAGPRQYKKWDMHGEHSRNCRDR